MTCNMNYTYQMTMEIISGTGTVNSLVTMLRVAGFIKRIVSPIADYV